MTRDSQSWVVADRPPIAFRRWAGACAGLLLLASAAVAFNWSTVTGLFARRAQDALARESFAPRPIPGDAWGRIDIDRIGAHWVVVEGVSQADLRRGPGHYPDTSRPGRGFVAVAGHRTTWGAPFRYLDRLRPGDVVRLTIAEGTFRYRVDRRPFSISPRDWSPFRDGRPTLLLTSCDPPGSAARRLVVHATPV